MIHDFAESLAKSQAQADAPWWINVYREAFPNLASAVNVRDDGWAQRGGIDRVLTLTSGKTLSVDEKVREEDWPDILLEYWSDFARRIPGWVAKDLACDFIAYAFVPSRTCHLLPFQTLRRAWRLNCKDWVRDFRRVEAHNNGYTTVSVAVPTPTLLRAFGDAVTVKWAEEAPEYQEDDRQLGLSLSPAAQSALAAMPAGFDADAPAEDLAAHAAACRALKRPVP